MFANGLETSQFGNIKVHLKFKIPTAWGLISGLNDLTLVHFGY